MGLLAASPYCADVMFLRKMQGIIYVPYRIGYPRKREELFFLVQAVIPSCAGWNGQASFLHRTS